AVCAPLDFQHRSPRRAKRARSGPAQRAESKYVGWIGYWRTSPIGEMLDNKNDSVGRSRPKPVLVDLQRTDFRLECRARNAEPCRGPGRPVDPSTACPQCLFDECFLVSSNGAGQHKGTFDRRPRGEPALVDYELVGVAHDH